MIFEFSSFGDTEYFFCSFILGVFLGAVYDVFRLVRIVLPKNKVLIFFEDILFCLISATAFLLLAFNVGSGRIRAFAGIGTIGGFSGYYLTIGKLVYKANEIIISFIKRVIKYIFVFVKKPFVFVFEKQKAAYKRRYIVKKRRKIMEKAINQAKKGFGLEEML